MEPSHFLQRPQFLSTKASWLWENRFHFCSLCFRVLSPADIKNGCLLQYLEESFETALCRAGVSCILTCWQTALNTPKWYNSIPPSGRLADRQQCQGGWQRRHHQQATLEPRQTRRSALSYLDAPSLPDYGGISGLHASLMNTTHNFPHGWHFHWHLHFNVTCIIDLNFFSIHDFPDNFSFRWISWTSANIVYWNVAEFRLNYGLF